VTWITIRKGNQLTDIVDRLLRVLALRVLALRLLRRSTTDPLLGVFNPLPSPPRKLLDILCFRLDEPLSVVPNEMEERFVVIVDCLNVSMSVVFPCMLSKSVCVATYTRIGIGSMEVCQVMLAVWFV
jgi:hypothetical protein